MIDREFIASMRLTNAHLRRVDELIQESKLAGDELAAALKRAQLNVTGLPAVTFAGCSGAEWAWSINALFCAFTGLWIALHVPVSSPHLFDAFRAAEFLGGCSVICLICGWIQRIRERRRVRP